MLLRCHATQGRREQVSAQTRSLHSSDHFRCSATYKQHVYKQQGRTIMRTDMLKMMQILWRCHVAVHTCSKRHASEDDTHDPAACHAADQTVPDILLPCKGAALDASEHTVASHLRSPRQMLVARCMSADQE